MSQHGRQRREPSRAPRKRAGERLAQLDEIVVEVEQLVAGGDGLARFEGIPIFVPRSAPGDRARVRLVERKPDFGRGEIVELIRSGPGRREPPCSFFGNCGGCDLQHLEDEYQVELKAQAVLETLRRLSGAPTIPTPGVVSGGAWSYRCRTQLHTESQADRVAVGYRGRRSSRLVEVDSCPILVPELERRLGTLDGVLEARAPRRIDLVAGDSETLTSAPVISGLPHGPVTITVGEFHYQLDARCFFQAHRELLPSFVEAVVGRVEGETAIDLYAGVGLLTLPLALRYSRVIAVESDRVAARYARQNAKNHRLTGIEVVPKAVESWIREMPESVDRVIVDPPRAGLSPPARRRILALHPIRITYVSCHAAALARDLRELLADYRIERLTLFDLFPQTGHMEAVVQLASSRS